MVRSRSKLCAVGALYIGCLGMLVAQPARAQTSPIGGLPIEPPINLPPDGPPVPPPPPPSDMGACYTLNGCSHTTALSCSGIWIRGGNCDDPPALVEPPVESHDEPPEDGGSCQFDCVEDEDDFEILWRPSGCAAGLDCVANGSLLEDRCEEEDDIGKIHPGSCQRLGGDGGGGGGDGPGGTTGEAGDTTY